VIGEIRYAFEGVKMSKMTIFCYTGGDMVELKRKGATHFESLTERR
jgi:hypothetical protein